MSSLSDGRPGDSEDCWGADFDPQPLVCYLEMSEYAPELWEQLTNALFHDGTVRFYAYSCVPRLINNAVDKHLFPTELFKLVTSIELERLASKSPVLSEMLEIDYTKALELLGRISLALLSEPCSLAMARRLLCFMALSKGLKIYATALHEYEEEHLGELFIVEGSASDLERG